VSDYQQLQTNLPVPQDDGAADHLPGAVMPSLVLRDTSGNEVALDRLGPAQTSYTSTPLTGRPGVDLPNGWDAIRRSQGTPNAAAKVTRRLVEALARAGVVAAETPGHQQNAHYSTRNNVDSAS